jgi:phospholipase/carboxylesterase
VSELVTRTRPAAGEAAGLLVLHHGRGADENDLLPLAEALDPRRRLHVVMPRGPLPAEGGNGYRWYLVPRPGEPDEGTYAEACAMLAELYDEVWAETGIAPRRTVLGGFSMGGVMSYALGLGAGRPAPAGILAFSGFLPRFADWTPQPPSGECPHAFIAHGARDRVIDVSHGREAAERLREAGLEVSYHESQAAHHIDPRVIPEAAAWLATTLPARLASRPAASP